MGVESKSCVVRVTKETVSYWLQILSRGVWHEIVAAYLACLSYTDHWIGEIMDAFFSSEVRQNIDMT